MNKIVVDTNIVFSAILNLNSRIAQIILSDKKYFEFYAPTYTRVELLKHKDKIQSIAKLNESQFVEIYELIFNRIQVLSHSLIEKEIYTTALELCKDIDIDDTIFVAFSEFLNCRLWTGDLKLLNGLKAKGFENGIKTEDLYAEFINNIK